MFGGRRRKFSGLFIRADTIDQEYSVARGTLGDIAFSGVNDKAEIIRHDNQQTKHLFTLSKCLRQLKNQFCTLTTKAQTITKPSLLLPIYRIKQQD